MKRDLSASSMLTHLTGQIGDERKFCVAFSGGLDSTVLLAALVQLRAEACPDLSLRAIHVHHGLSQFADHWVAHAQTFCQQLQVQLEVVHVSVDAKKEGIEAAARAARYQAFADHLTAGETLLTAQHLNDQCETFLLALKRGSGPAGLSAMAAHSERNGYMLLRPFLHLSRQQLEQFATDAGLQWIEDDSNQDPRFDRNFLRLKVLPSLYERWPHFPQAVSRSAALCAEQEALLDELLSESLLAFTDHNRSLDISAMASLSALRRQALLRRWLAEQGARMPSRDQLQRIWDEVALSRDDAAPQFQLHHLSVRRFRQRLYVLPPMASLKQVVLPWDTALPLRLPDGLGQLQACEGAAQGAESIRLPRDDEQVSVRFQAPGMIEKVGREHARQSKKLWQELNVPPWQRERMPLVYYNEQLMAAPGLFITRQALAQANEPQWQVMWRPSADKKES
ncbi:tRNA lysidine(34) synthetase TilS [Ewingella americana]|uniref:tRNA(Ile)-lysidine synthase n=1 Tax=Ewingella americana TaxID=41202 RepID=A0A502GIU3_9GAMM|nr:tRNA lysidine(34) synthetase TilS [Ewingella americana]